MYNRCFSAFCVCLMFLMLTACAGSDSAAVTAQPEPADSLQLPTEGLPAFPLDREGSVIVDRQISGDQFHEKSSAPSIAINALQFNVAAGATDWAIYQFNPGDDLMISLTVDISITSGNAPWIGLADYDSGRWKFGNQLETGSEQFELNDGTDFLSDGNNFYFAVVGYDGAQFSVNGATIQTDADLFSISGTVFDPLDAASVEDVEMFLSPGSVEVLTDVNGDFSFELLEPGSYTISPSKEGQVFDPVSIDVEVTDADVVDVNFMVQDIGLPTSSVSGNVQFEFAGLEGVTLSLSPGGLSAMTDASGDFSIGGVVNGNYTLTPSLSGYNFSPVDIAVVVNDADSTGNDFTASEVASPTWDISGTISLNAGFLAGVTVTAAPGGESGITDANGDYTISGLANGSYTVTPSLTGYEFNPVSRNVNVSGADNTGNDFDASEVVIPTYNISGEVTIGTGTLQGVTITVTPGGDSAVTDLNGMYTVTDIEDGSYTVTPSLSGYVFTPASRNVEVSGGNVVDVDFDATPADSGNYNVSGVVGGPPGGLSGATITLMPGNYTVLSGTSGGYTLTNIPSGIYTATATKGGWIITPFDQQVVVANTNVTGINWFASPPL